MKIMLINPSLPVFGRVPSLPLGLISIASYLNHYGHEAKIVECLVENSNFESEIDKFKPDIIGISVLSYLSSIEAKRLTGIIRKKKIPVVWGGQTPTAMPELVLRAAESGKLVIGEVGVAGILGKSKAPVKILGEGEITWLELVNTLSNGGDINGVNGLAFLENGSVKFTPQRNVADISLFPDIDWELVDVEKYFSSFFGCDKMLYLHASKGCPAQCTFCSNQIYHQHKNRCRNPEQVIRDIDYLYSKGANGTSNSLIFDKLRFF